MPLLHIAGGWGCQTSLLQVHALHASLSVSSASCPTQASVGKTSKHCRSCDKCVEGFDHHCKWLNNCVGMKTYSAFFLLVGTACSMLTLQFAWCLWQFTTSFTLKEELQLKVHDKYQGNVSYVGWQVRVLMLSRHGHLVARTLRMCSGMSLHLTSGDKRLVHA